MTKLTEHNGSKELLVEISFRTMRTIHLPEVSFYTFYGSVTDNLHSSLITNYGFLLKLKILLSGRVKSRIGYVL